LQDAHASMTLTLTAFPWSYECGRDMSVINMKHKLGTYKETFISLSHKGLL
jgi:hypothetical protein